MNSVEVVLKKLETVDLTPEFCFENGINKTSSERCKEELLQWREANASKLTVIHF